MPAAVNLLTVTVLGPAGLLGRPRLTMVVFSITATVKILCTSVSPTYV